MNKKDKPSSPEMVSCEICLKEMPKSGAKSAEASDYTMYFCGLECFHQWQQDLKKEEK